MKLKYFDLYKYLIAGVLGTDIEDGRFKIVNSLNAC